MMKKECGRVFRAYLRYRVGVLLLGAACAAIWLVVLVLSRLTTEVAQYASLLCGCLVLVVAVIDYIRFATRHRELASLQNKIVVGLDGLPHPRNLLEEDYTLLLEAAHVDKIERISQADRLHSDRMEYDTLWAHQIKTPIAAMRLLLQGEDSEPNRALQAELFQIEQYVNMVLTYSRLDSDSSDMVVQSYELDGLVRQAVRKYAPLFIRKKLQLDLRPLSGEVLTDEKWLVFVIEQLLSNALKYTSRGRISIYQEEPGTLVIADTGIGIAPEDLPRLGEKGFTGYNGRADKKATGLGLYLCRRILARLSHRMTITSSVGEGTTVKLFLASDELHVE